MWQYSRTHLQTRDPTCWRRGGRRAAGVQTQDRIMYNGDVGTEVELRRMAQAGRGSHTSESRQAGRIRLAGNAPVPRSAIRGVLTGTEDGARGEARQRVEAGCWRWMTGAGC